ncbi:ABC transporter ATP-binding protein [Amedibacillus sp. YH-ame6]
MEYAVEMLNITKEFPGIRANDNVTVRLKKGTIHALLGENGAGKSTLMSILFGLYQPTSGIIKVNDKEVKIQDPNVATDLGIGMVHQHFKLVECFTVTENIILGMEPTKYGMVDIKKATKDILKLSDQYGLKVDPNAKISDISVGMQQRVEILKMLYRNADILIFDEPTAVLTPQEIEELIKIMQLMIKEGKSILLITHKLKEIKQVADECSVLRRGKYIGTVNVKDTSEQEMADMMVGRSVNFNIDKAPAQPGDVVLDIKNLTVKNGSGLPVVNDFSLQVRKGEIVGLAGIDGNGQTELVYALSGLIKTSSGQILLDGKDITNMSVKQRCKEGMGHVPEDRHKHGLILDFMLKENFIVHAYNEAPFCKNGIMQVKPIDAYAEELIQEFDVRSGEGKNTPTRSMSGGNQQKAIIAREIHRSPELLIVVQPTRGLDVGAIEYIHKRIVSERDNGRAILLVSLELDEVLDLSDRIAVIYEGSMCGEMDAKSTNEKELGLMMSGSKRKESA